MNDIIRRKKALSVSPLKTSQTIGAALAFLGVNGAVPLLHGSQGCTAFAKVFFVRHFREPVPLQTTAMDQISSVMGADDNIKEALRVICEKSSPSLVGLATTGLAETQGADIRRAVYEFREESPPFENTHVVAVNTPDFSGSFESGFATAVKGMLNVLVPDGAAKPYSRKRQVTILCGANLTPGDLEFVAESVESFGLRPLLIPDLSGSLDGHLSDAAFSPVTTGGVSVQDIAMAGDSIAVLAIGESIHPVAEGFAKRVGLPLHTFGHLLGLEATDDWLMTLSQLSNQPVSAKYQRHRRQLQDAMLDTHFMLGMAPIAVAGDPDLVLGFSRLLRNMGSDIVAAVVPYAAQALESEAGLTPMVGDLEELEKSARESHAHLLITNSHGAESAKRLDIPLLRAGFPQYDLLGGFQRTWFGYRGTSQALFDIANLLTEHHQEMAPYQSVYTPTKNGGNSVWQ
ncbi:nitrogenase iron-molybdenum cofactor biosynthesis protein NifN [Thalassolituus oleivorans]|uniref:nitrogenase iron-molybdenum cofactor biosynthesis protein NifN n=1 Tax=Thalassolituus oleivorans TaxID=187493 RepID=UPI0023F3B8AD|nr:nitrogenase iron-molybdenum cofactor biosynthesis protein NifN [Thalassolituus oleivorans]|tara:strand:- start:35746 stop:37119 length:1374 start_codon:yes stop_codon:yes gene_type:complete